MVESEPESLVQKYIEKIEGKEEGESLVLKHIESFNGADPAFTAKK
jgi:hypothetical protein